MSYRGRGGGGGYGRGGGGGGFRGGRGGGFRGSGGGGNFGGRQGYDQGPPEQGSVVTQLQGAPSHAKISKVNDGVNLSWDPPPNEVIIEYSVYLAVRYLAVRSATSQVGRENKTVLSTSTKLFFERVYCGPNNNCRIEPHQIAEAHIHQKSVPAIIFRIYARTERGYGPALQVRWLQGSTKPMPTG